MFVYFAFLISYFQSGLRPREILTGLRELRNFNTGLQFII